MTRVRRSLQMAGFSKPRCARSRCVRPPSGRRPAAGIPWCCAPRRARFVERVAGLGAVVAGVEWMVTSSGGHGPGPRRDRLSLSRVGRSSGEPGRFAGPATHPGGIPVAAVSTRRLVPCVPRPTGGVPATSPPHGASVRHPSTVGCTRSSPTMRSSACRHNCSGPSKTPAAIHTSRRVRIVVAEQVESAIVARRVGDLALGKRRRHEHLGKAGGVRHPVLYRDSCLSCVTDTRFLPVRSLSGDRRRRGRRRRDPRGLQHRGRCREIRHGGRHGGLRRRSDRRRR